MTKRRPQAEATDLTRIGDAGSESDMTLKKPYNESAGFNTKKTVVTYV